MANPKLKRFFNIYAQNLSVVRRGTKNLVTEPNLDDIIVCPICFQYFTRQQLDPRILSIEHVPPEILGGKERTLTCKKCNNSASPLDSRLKEKLESSDFLMGIVGASSPKDTWLTVDGVTVPIRARVEVNGRWNATPRRSNPHDFKKITSILQERPRQDLSIRLTFNTFEDGFSGANILRIAYLWAFSILGYSFLMNPNIRLILDQIQNPTKQIMPNRGLLPLRFPDEFLGLNLIYNPVELRSFLAVFDVKTSNGGQYRPAVILPGASEPGNTIYEWLAENKDYEISLRKIAEPDDVNAFVNQPFATYEIWNNLERE